MLVLGSRLRRRGDATGESSGPGHPIGKAGIARRGGAILRRWGLRRRVGLRRAGGRRPAGGFARRRAAGLLGGGHGPGQAPREGSRRALSRVSVGAARGPSLVGKKSPIVSEPEKVGELGEGDRERVVEEAAEFGWPTLRASLPRCWLAPRGRRGEAGRSGRTSSEPEATPASPSRPPTRARDSPSRPQIARRAS